MNDVQVSRTGDTFTIIDERAVINAGSGCVQVSEHEVSCSSADEGSFFDGWVETSSRRPPASQGRERSAATRGREEQRRGPVAAVFGLSYWRCAQRAPRHIATLVASAPDEHHGDRDHAGESRARDCLGSERSPLRHGDLSALRVALRFRASLRHDLLRALLRDRGELLCLIAAGLLDGFADP